MNGFSTGEEDSRGAADQICCLVDEGVRCTRPAGNASYSKRIQKTVTQRRLKLNLDNLVSHADSCFSFSRFFFSFLFFPFFPLRTKSTRLARLFTAILTRACAPLPRGRSIARSEDVGRPTGTFRSGKILFTFNGKRRIDALPR